MIDDFNGNNEHLIACIEALLDLDVAKALVPHGIGGHARGLISAAGVRLSAKDAEIAELRACIADLRAVCHESAGKILEHRLAAQQAESERDEARECVGRLCEALRPFAEKTPIEPGGQLIGLMREDFTSARAALAATPEHLRR